VPNLPIGTVALYVALSVGHYRQLFFVLVKGSTSNDLFSDTDVQQQYILQSVVLLRVLLDCQLLTIRRKLAFGFNKNQVQMVV